VVHNGVNKGLKCQHTCHAHCFYIPWLCVRHCTLPVTSQSAFRPWNSKNTKDRLNGEYYEREWRSALEEAGAEFVSITSFNEWHEGTQIEPAVSSKSVDVDHLLGRKAKGRFTYLSYGDDPFLYLDLTRKWTEKLKSRSERNPALT